jgi:hypothetical protein
MINTIAMACSIVGMSIFYKLIFNDDNFKIGAVYYIFLVFNIVVFIANLKSYIIDILKELK